MLGLEAHVAFWLWKLYLEFGSHICSVIYVKYMYSASCHMVNADFIFGIYMCICSHICMSNMWHIWYICPVRLEYFFLAPIPLHFKFWYLEFSDMSDFRYIRNSKVWISSMPIKWCIRIFSMWEIMMYWTSDNSDMPEILIY